MLSKYTTRRPSCVDLSAFDTHVIRTCLTEGRSLASDPSSLGRAPHHRRREDTMRDTKQVRLCLTRIDVGYILATSCGGARSARSVTGAFRAACMTFICTMWVGSTLSFAPSSFYVRCSWVQLGSVECSTGQRLLSWNNVDSRPVLLSCATRSDQEGRMLAPHASPCNRDFLQSLGVPDADGTIDEA